MKEKKSGFTNRKIKGPIILAGNQKKIMLDAPHNLLLIGYDAQGGIKGRSTRLKHRMIKEKETKSKSYNLNPPGNKSGSHSLASLQNFKNSRKW